MVVCEGEELERSEWGLDLINAHLIQNSQKTVKRGTLRGEISKSGIGNLEILKLFFHLFYSNTFIDKNSLMPMIVCH